MTTDYYTVFWARWNNFSTIGFYLNAKKCQTLPHVTKWRHNFVKWRLIGISCRCSILEIWGIIYAKSHLNPSGAHFRMPCYVSFKIPILNLSCFLTISRAQDPVQSRNSWRHRRRQVAAWSTPSVIWVKRSDSQWRGSSLRRSQCSQLPPTRSNARLLNTNNTRFVRFELTQEVMSTAGGARGNFFASFESRTLDCLRCHREAGLTDSNWGRMLPSCSHVFAEQDAMEASEQNVREASEKQGENWELLRMERVKISLNQDARWRRIWH